MAKTKEDMAPKEKKLQKLQMMLTGFQAERAERLADLTDEHRPNEIYRQALNLGLNELEQQFLRHISFENALKVGAKLDRRTQPIHEAIARLEETGGDAEVLALLKEAIGA